MKVYRAYATMSIDLVCEFEVEDDEDEWACAKDLDGSDFRELDGSGEWKVYEVDFVREIANAQV